MIKNKSISLKKRISWHGWVFKEISHFWSNIRTLFYEHKTLFDILFLILYSAEQLILFILILIDSKNAHIYSGVFAILVISTISFEKICMESRYALLKQHTSEEESDRENLKREYDNLVRENKELIRVVESTMRIKK